LKNKHSKKGKHFPGNQTKFFFDWKVFSLTEKCLPLTNFSNGKQTQESLESGFPETTFRETNIALILLLFLDETSFYPIKS
jgi:hypothetical protein